MRRRVCMNCLLPQDFATWKRVYAGATTCVEKLTLVCAMDISCRTIRSTPDISADVIASLKCLYVLAGKRPAMR